MIIGKVDEDNIPLVFTFDEDEVEEIVSQLTALIQLKIQLQNGGPE
jgi:hypothetical protein